MKQLYITKLVIVIALLLGWNCSVNAQTSTFATPGGPYTYTVPMCTYSLNVVANGAQGGFVTTIYGFTGAGEGGRVNCVLAVTPGQVFNVYVGGQGTNGSTVGGSTAAGGINGGGSAYAWPSGSPEAGGAGGGSSDIRLSNTDLSSRVIVAGGGGGDGGNGADMSGGVGGGTTAGTGSALSPGTGGGGGSNLTGGGAGGGYPGYTYGSNGSLFQGGSALSPNPGIGGGGGGGYYGGGGGGWSGGGGGSSYTDPVMVTSFTHTQGVNSGNGLVTITPNCNQQGTIVGSTTVCMGTTPTFSNPTGSSIGTWSSSITTVATISPTGVLTPVSLGTTTITYNVCNTCGAIATATVTVFAVPSAIGGPSIVCSGTTATLNATPSGGTWTSTATSVASIDASSGILTGGAIAGTSTISYALPGGCSIPTKAITTNLQPDAITTTGATTICGSFTTSLSETTTGGAWTSSNNAIASVGSTGVVTGGATGGNPVISYTAPTGCASTATLTVNALTAIGGVPSMCNGQTTLLSDGAPGGTWSSSNTAVATVDATGLVTSAGLGSTTISYNIASTGCTATITAFVTGVPSVSSVTGGGSYCPGTVSTVLVGLSGSTAGVGYQLYNGSTPVGTPVVGSGLTINFGPQSTTGTYSVIADPGTGCATLQSGSATISLYSAPTAFTVTASNGGNYCTGGTGVHILLSSSTIGVNYQLFNSGGTPIGTTVSGTSAPLDFGLVIAGTYNVVATNATTGCISAMSGTPTVTANPLPTTNTVTETNGGGYCYGTTSNVHVGLNGSVSGTSYQLLYGSLPLGAPMAGTGFPLDFGAQSTPGTYTVLATTAAGCTATMFSSATVTVNALPTVFNVTGGGSYCLGTTPLPIHVGLNGSTAGISYQLYNTGTSVGTPLIGTGGSLDFGIFPAGAYTVSATNGATGCGINMSGSASIVVNPLPTQFTVTVPNSGAYCAGSTGPVISLSSSVVGVTYNLLFGVLPGGTLVSSASGTGSSIAFLPVTATGTYSISAINTITGCTVNTMLNNVAVTTNPLPTGSYSVTGGGNYCIGGTGKLVGLSSSNSGISYQLYVNGIATGTAINGTGPAFNYPLQTTVGSYTIVGRNTSTGCTNNMTGSVSVSTTGLPVIYNVTGGGGYCTGAVSNVHVGLAASDVGINYQLMKGTTPVGAPVAGIGGAIDFGTDTVGTYTVVATNITTGCTSNMFGSATVFTNPRPAVYAIVATSGGSYCLGGAGLPVSDSNSDLGVNYQLLNGGVAAGGPLAGTGTLLNFGNQTAAGNYTVVATTVSTGCTSNMRGAALIAISPLPTVYTVTSVGTTYCSGGAGVQINLSASATGYSYQLYNGAATVGGPISGTGAALSFGSVPTGVYTVVAMNTTSTCTNTMAGTINVTTNPLPALYTISGGGSYCSGGAGVPVSLSSSNTGINYQLTTGGGSAGVPLAGTGSALNFGNQTTAGGYTIVATNTTTGCTNTMIGTATVTINPLPALSTVIGGGPYCTGGLGSDISISGSAATSVVSYQLYNGAAIAGPAMPGTGAPIDFNLQTAPGTYTVVATNTSTTCSATMTGSVTVSLYPQPILYSVTGGGNYCPAGTGVPVGLSGSNTGVNYQLYDNASIAIGTPVAGNGLPLSFGLQMAVGTYTVVAMSTTTSCARTMSGSVMVGLNALPVTHNVAGGGNYCSGGAGLSVNLDGSDLGNTYQLKDGIVNIGSSVTGTGFALDFGTQTLGGTYTIVATSGATGCSNIMAGDAVIVVNPLPTALSVSGGGTYCAGTGGVNVGLVSSQTGINYQLFDGLTPVGTAVTGTGFPLNFGAETAAGTYVVVGTNTVSNCSNNMLGNALVAVNPLPTAYTVTGGGNYCPGSTGVHVSLSGSDMGMTYQLFNGLIPTGAPISGTGSSIDFGLQTAPGTYKVVGTNNTTFCVNQMANTVAIGINTAPGVYTLTSSASQYCAGSSGVGLYLSSSDMGVNYQVYVNGIPSGSPVAGNGLELDFGLQTSAGTYTVVGNNASTGCASNMASSATIVINPLPTTYSVTGGGNYCPGGIGEHVGLAGSHTGNSYQLYIGGVPVGPVVLGTGFAIDFGLQTAPGIYSVVANNPLTTCVKTMAGTVTIGVNALPVAYTVTGGGSYCTSADGVAVGLSGSNTGVTYQLSNSGSLIGTPIAGTGLGLTFGLQTAAGSYTVVASSSATGCANTMAGAASVVINALPAPYAVIGGGNYCPGGSGVHVGLFNSNVGVNYQLFNGTLAVGVPSPGTGIALDFGYQTTAGTYTIVATNTATGCINNMSGSAVIVLNTPPVAYSVIGGGNYCASGTGVHIGLNSTASGVSYQLFDGLTPISAPLAGSGGPIDFGLQTGVGAYTVVGTTTATGCAGAMAGTATVTVSPLVTPSVVLSGGDHDTVCSGTPVTITATVVNGGTTPIYSWNVNGIPVVSAGNSYTYAPAVGDAVGLTLTSNATCATPAVVNASLPLTVMAHGMPTVSISSNLNPVCAGSSVTFAAVTAFGGSAPTLSWIVNGIDQSDAAVFTYTPTNADVVSATLTSNYFCRLSTLASSNTVNMEVDNSVVPAVTVTANPGTHVRQGQVILLTASITNTVADPTYQWMLNGEPIPGAIESTYTATSYSDMDVFSCQVTSGGGCAGLKGGNSVTITIGTTGVAQVTSSGSDLKLVPNPNKGIFTIKGTLGTTADEEVSVEVSDMLGQVIYKETIMAHGGNIDQTVQLNGTLANGMYLLNLRSASANDVFHVVIEQ